MLPDLHLPLTLPSRAGQLTLRRATRADLDPLIGLLSDDPVSASRGDVAAPGDRDAYLAALTHVVEDASNELVVATDAEGIVVATLQLTRIPGMARRGATRLLVEAVRVRSDMRSGGIGAAMMRWVTDEAAPALGSPLVQLTSDASRVDAHRFYERLGFAPSHIGFKYHLPPAAQS